MARSESPSANLVLRVTLLAIETLGALRLKAGCPYKQVVDLLIVSQRPMTVFKSLPLTQDTKRKKDKSSMGVGMLEGRGFELLTFRLRGAILESFLLNRLKSWAHSGPTCRVAQKKG